MVQDSGRYVATMEFSLETVVAIGKVIYDPGSPTLPQDLDGEIESGKAVPT